MTAMTCKLSGLFSLGEDFDDEDLLGTDWTPCSDSRPANMAAAGSSFALRASSVAHGEPQNICHQQRIGEKLAGLRDGTASGSGVHGAAGQTVALGLRQLSSSSPPPPAQSNPQPSLAPQQSRANTKELMNPCAAQDEFDDWDVDLADLDECDSQMGQLQKPAASAPPASAAEPPSSANALRPSAYGGRQSVPNQTLGELRTARSTPRASGYNAALWSPSVAHRLSFNPRPASATCPQTVPVLPSCAASSPAPSTVNNPRWATPGATAAAAQARGLFETVSSAASPSANTSAPSPHPLRTPVFTNRLAQLVSASNKLPKKRPRSEGRQPRTRRFPGPAGLLPQQPQGQNLDEIVVSVPQTPAHGAVARLPSQGSSSQAEEEEFSGGAWAAMKAEMGLDERNPSCFLHSYSVVMVLRKAALKQLPRNKVPNMAVLLKSIVHTHADARAVFKDPTGEIQGTVHRRLLEERTEELKVGAVLLLKQVGVFSPSHRNHYLNVTPNNLLRIYAPDGVGLSPTRLPPLVLEPTMLSPAREAGVLRGPVSRMQLEFDEEDEEGKEGGGRTEQAEVPQEQTHTEENKSVRSSRAPPKSAANPAPRDPDWDADDDLDELLGELPEDACGL
ncbi:homologous recombination OB-fold protein [Kryptolebias marmoratus]|uniref:homologous recombination OB-fold protein n=1 Tax=Kryptolebias marmoratus TaxID=37003 RepID=UPI0007F891C7|nr:homologous recombination OB-fold protein [Kryptolebias marmoratus]